MARSSTGYHRSGQPVPPKPRRSGEGHTTLSEFLDREEDLAGDVWLHTGKHWLGELPRPARLKMLGVHQLYELPADRELTAQERIAAATLDRLVRPNGVGPPTTRQDLEELANQVEVQLAPGESPQRALWDLMMLTLGIHGIDDIEAAESVGLDQLRNVWFLEEALDRGVARVLHQGESRKVGLDDVNTLAKMWLKIPDTRPVNANDRLLLLELADQLAKAAQPYRPLEQYRLRMKTGLTQGRGPGPGPGGGVMWRDQFGKAKDVSFGLDARGFSTAWPVFAKGGSGEVVVVLARDVTPDMVVKSWLGQLSAAIRRAFAT